MTKKAGGGMLTASLRNNWLGRTAPPAGKARKGPTAGSPCREDLSLLCHQEEASCEGYIEILGGL